MTRRCASDGCEQAVTRPRAKYCTEQCRKRNEKRRAKERGAEWATRRYPDRMVDKTCAHCGKDYRGRYYKPDAGHKRTYCSAECDAQARSWHRRTVFVVDLDWRECTACSRPFISHRGRVRCDGCRDVSKRGWVAGFCKGCGEPFVGRGHPDWPCRYCSQRCINRAAKERRRMLKRQGNYEEVWRSKVYERDEWTCRLCQKPVERDEVVPHPLAPTLDHIVPLALGGDHSYANIQTAHFRCNTLKAANLDGQVRLAV